MAVDSKGGRIKPSIYKEKAIIRQHQKHLITHICMQACLKGNNIGIILKVRKDINSREKKIRFQRAKLCDMQTITAGVIVRVSNTLRHSFSQFSQYS